MDAKLVRQAALRWVGAAIALGVAPQVFRRHAVFHVMVRGRLPIGINHGPLRIPHCSPGSVWINQITLSLLRLNF